MAYRIDVDAGCFTLWKADESEVDGKDIFSTLEEAKAEALQQAIPERDQWADCVRTIRTTTKRDAL